MSISEVRAGKYKILSECFYPPDERLITILNGSGISAESGFQDLAKEIGRVDGLCVLKEDHAKLFVGPFKLLAPPYGSVYLEGQRLIMGQSTLDVQKLYQRERLKLEMKEAPDHIAAELEFMYYLAIKQFEAESKQDGGAAGECFDKQKYFLQIHLGSWAKEFTEMVEKSAETDFYRSLASLTRTFIEEDLEYLRTEE